jgi:hypothetical protein
VATVPRASFARFGPETAKLVSNSMGVSISAL